MRHSNKDRFLTKIWQMTADDEADNRSALRKFYNTFFEREPDESAISAYSSTDGDTLLKMMLSSAEFKSRLRSAQLFSARENPDLRILLFGAYGNGNLGDAIQARSVLNLVRPLCPDAEVWACSAMDSPFPFSHEFVLRPQGIFNPRVLRNFNLLIVGGGGLLAHPHQPLNNQEWQASIDTSVALVGIGADYHNATMHETLIKKAIFVSGRDDISTDSLRRFRSDVTFVPDPVLCDSSLVRRGPLRLQFECSRPNTLWILKNGMTSESKNRLSTLIKPNDRVCFLEPALDFPLVQSFPQARPCYTADDLISQIDKVEAVVSMRYHGCIFSMLRGKPCIAVGQHKSSWLMARYGNKDFSKHDFQDIENVDFSRYVDPAGQIEMERQIFLGEMKRLMAMVA